MGFTARLKEMIGYSDEAYDETPEAEPQERGERGAARSDEPTGQLVVVKPRQFEDARLIVDHLKEHRIIVLNLEDASKELACRVMDFLAGAVYAKDGRFERVASNAYVITPCGVEFLGGAVGEASSDALWFPQFRASACG